MTLSNRRNPAWSRSRYSVIVGAVERSLDYLDRLHAGFRRLLSVMAPDGRLIMLIGDGRKSGVFYSIHTEVIHWQVLPLEAILIKEGDHARRARHFRYGPTPFIPTLHEYVLIFTRGKS